MRKFAKRALIVLFFNLAALLFPCDIRFAPAPSGVQRGKEITVSLYVELEHRRCHVALEDTSFQTEGIVIKKKGTWEQTQGNEYKMDLTIVLTGAKGEIRVVRECDKKGVSRGTLRLAASA